MTYPEKEIVNTLVACVQPPALLKKKSERWPSDFFLKESRQLYTGYAISYKFKRSAPINPNCDEFLSSLYPFTTNLTRQVM